MSTEVGNTVDMDSTGNVECVSSRTRGSNGVKRKGSTSGTSKKQKRTTDPESEVQLVTLPDDVLLEIFKKCDHHGLAQIRVACPQFERLVQDFSLWRRVVFTQEAAQWTDLYFIYCNVNVNTKELKIMGNQATVLPSNWVRQVFQKSPYLETVSFHRQVLDAGIITINVFPSTLTTLDLSRTNMLRLPMERSYFKDISKFLPNLKNLNLSNCLWFEPHSLMAISKCDKLEVLELADCQQVRDCLAYCGLSTRTGFPALITLDLRRCAISNSELVCFSSITTLKNLYLENDRESPTIIDTALLMMCTFHQSRVNNQVHLVQRVRLEKLVVRFYQLKYTTLLRLAEDVETLRYIDVTGVGIEKACLERFRNLRPDVTLVAEDQELFNNN